MATPNPSPHLNIKSAARKLPIKRKNPQPLSSSPNPNPNPNPVPKTEPKTEPDTGYDDEDDELEDEDEELQDEEGLQIVAVAEGGDLKAQPPFKFHRVWSESDEIRFLQGLLGCFSQGMVFPRDLNLFYDRFSESMPQPYTRSQLSEKLRRLRKKYRIMSSRIARGQDPSRLAPHDRDLLHLCTRLWDPASAASSPFSPPNPADGGGSNKRRRRNPRLPSGSTPAQLPSHSSPSAPPPADDDDKGCPDNENGNLSDSPDRGIDEDDEVPVSDAKSVMGETGNVVAKAIMDVFDASLKEVRMALARQGLLFPVHGLKTGSATSDLAKRWSEQRVAELDVLACRLRLVLEHAIRD